ncbi:MAG: MATE family efflux transporter [Blastopirellula sp.]|nr:MATE family efflux transporter [Blastopirellula sp.]
MLALALPVFAEESLTLLVGYTDWWLTGSFLPGDEYKAAMGLMAYLLWLIPILFAAVAIGATAMVSRFVGAGEQRLACRVVNQAMLVGVVLSLVMTVATLLGARSFVSLLQLSGAAGELATRYCLIVAWVIPAIMVEQVASAALRGAGDTVSGMVAKSIVNVINVTVSTTLVLGLGPFPKMGWDGIAIGTACGHLVGGLILLTLLLRGRAGLHLKWSNLRSDWSIIRRLLKVGLPGGVDMLAVIGCHLTYVSIINRLGETAAAAHGMGVQVEALAYLPGTAFQVAAATIAGQYLGAQDGARAKRGVSMAVLAGGSFMSLTGLVFYFLGGYLCAFFSGMHLDETAEIAAGLLRIVAFSMPSLAVTMVLSGALRGAGDTRWALLITLVGFAGIRIPGALWLACDEITIPWLQLTITGMGWSVYGAWYAMLVDVIVRSFLAAARFFHGGWQHARV